MCFGLDNTILLMLGYRLLVIMSTHIILMGPQNRRNIMARIIHLHRSDYLHMIQSANDQTSGHLYQTSYCQTTSGGSLLWIAVTCRLRAACCRAWPGSTNRDIRLN